MKGTMFGGFCQINFTELGGANGCLQAKGLPDAGPRCTSLPAYFDPYSLAVSNMAAMFSGGTSS